MPKEIPPATIENLFPPNDNYTYFENGQDHPFRYSSRKFEMVNAWWLADAALLAYAEPAFAIPLFQKAGFQVQGSQPFSGPSTQCYIMHNDDFAIIAFRGSQVYKPGTQRGLLDILQDMVNDVSADEKIRLVDSEQGGFVHQGIKGALNEVWEKVEQHLNQLKTESPTRPFFFTGHSLGAALATLAADRYGSVQALYTFGSPLVGDEEFKNDFYVNTYRFVNNNDIVTRIALLGSYDPLRAAPGCYQHVGQLKYIDSQGAILDNPSRWNRLTDSFRGSFGQFINAIGHLRTGWIWELPIDHLTDHAPLFYTIHIWNSYEQGG
jgi:triacylglycerol lipase